jgi:hypothetical protein
MKKILSCRRSIVAVFGISCLTLLGMYHGVDISGIAIAVAGIVASVAGANAYQSKGSPQTVKEEGSIS